MAVEQILTYQDLIDRLAAYTGGGALDPDNADILAAAQDAYADVVHGFPWKYLTGKGRIILNGDYTTGTVEYDYTGGAHERMLTLTTGTWPTWAAYGTIKIGDLIYAVEDRKSSSIITLVDGQCPTADIAAGTTYQLWQSSYPLPGTLRKIYNLFLDGETWRMEPISPSDWLAYESMQATAGTPNFYALIGSPDIVGSLSLQFAPYPDEDHVLVFMYDRIARELFYRGYETEARAGSVSASAGSTTVTGSGTSFHASMVGSIIRFSRNTSAFPTGKFGRNRFLEQAQIKSVASATSLTVTQALTYTHASSTKYVISDPVDVPPSMHNVVLRAGEAFLDQARNPKAAQTTLGRYRLAMTQARERDRMTVGENSPFTAFLFESARWDSPLLPGVG